jgi:nuclear pore complex protein Nup133
VRFAAEDLREPIIKDNLLDDDILREHMEKNRVGHWFQAAIRVGKALAEQDKRQQGLRLDPAMLASQIMDAGALEAEMPVSEDMFDGGDEESAQEQDVVMQGS